MWLENFYHILKNQIDLLRITDIIDIFAVAYLVYISLKFIRETRMMRLLKGVVILVLATLLSETFNLNTLSFILSNVLQVGLISILVIFQPELRKALENIGKTTVGKWFDQKGEFDESAMQMIKQLSHAAQALSNSYTGALIVIENSDNIDNLISSGIRINAETTSELLENIFVSNTPLHDGAVIIRDNKIELATCVLPLSQNPNISQELGTRHRAGLGVSEESDAVVVIVSEETGRISIAHKGVLDIGYTEDTLKDRKIDLLNSSVLTKNDVNEKGCDKIKSYLKGGENK